MEDSAHVRAWNKNPGEYRRTLVRFPRLGWQSRLITSAWISGGRNTAVRRLNRCRRLLNPVPCRPRPCCGT